MILREVREGLTSMPRTLPSKYFYDQRGSELFEEITQLPEYYPTRAERALLVEHARKIISKVDPSALIELGAGNAEKTRILIEAMLAHGERATYVPLDVSEDFLAETAADLNARYERLTVVPVVADMTRDFQLPRDIPSPVLFAFLGSTIGNFHEDQAIVLLRRVRDRMRAGDRLLLGTDLIKAPERLYAAYNDSRGVTAEFNRNVLHVLNRELGAEFEPDLFEHEAIFNAEQSRIEMYLIATRLMHVDVPGIGIVDFRKGDRIRTEISCKYNRETVSRLLQRAGMSLEEWLTDGDFALAS
jgi:L-histidine Nalpha-methyltransferase